MTKKKLRKCRVLRALAGIRVEQSDHCVKEPEKSTSGLATHKSLVTLTRANSME